MNEVLKTLMVMLAGVKYLAATVFTSAAVMAWMRAGSAR